MKLSKKRTSGMLTVLAWGPIETLSNGHFIRVYTLVQLLTRVLEYTVLIIEYPEKIRTKNAYNLIRLPIPRCYKIQVLGNERTSTENIVSKYLRFVLYQVVNIIKLRYYIKRSKALILCGVLFFPSLILSKIMNRNIVIITDPQMLLSERESRRRKRTLKFILYIFERLIFRLSNLTIAISENMKMKVINGYGIPSHRVIVIPHILPPELNGKIICKTETLEGKLKLAFLGALNLIHNIEAVKYLIYVMKFVKRRYGDRVKLLIIGEIGDSIKRTLIEFAKTINVDDVIEFLGFVPDTESLICKEVDILLAPMFTMSGVSTKMLYYLKFADKTIIASKEAVEGIEHLVTNHRRVFIAEDPVSFIRKLLNIIESHGVYSQIHQKL